jgi:hypothetical protein
MRVNGIYQACLYWPLQEASRQHNEGGLRQWLCPLPKFNALNELSDIIIICIDGLIFTTFYAAGWIFGWSLSEGPAVLQRQIQPTCP